MERINQKYSKQFRSFPLTKGVRTFLLKAEKFLLITFGNSQCCDYSANPIEPALYRVSQITNVSIESISVVIVHK